MKDPEPRSSSFGVARVFVAALTGLVAMTALATTVAAQEDQFEIVVPIATVVRAAEGSETLLSATSTPDDLVGEACEVTARSENQTSVHPGNDLVVATGENQVVLSDVERSSGEVVTASGTLVLGDDVEIFLIMGPDGVFSAGIEVRFQCPPPTTTTTEATTSTAVETTTTIAATTTTEVSATTLAPTTTQVPASTTIPDEVLLTTLLPFTGPDDDAGRLGLFALALGASGVLLLVAARSREPATITMFFSWDAACARCDREARFFTPHGRLCYHHTRVALNEDTSLWMPTRIDGGE